MVKINTGHLGFVITIGLTVLFSIIMFQSEMRVISIIISIAVVFISYITYFRKKIRFYTLIKSGLRGKAKITQVQKLAETRDAVQLKLDLAIDVENLPNYLITITKYYPTYTASTYTLHSIIEVVVNPKNRDEVYILRS